MRLRIIYIFALVVTLSSCFRDEEYSSELIIRPYIQHVSKDDAMLPYSGCVAHVFDANSSEWEVASWEDAVAGVLSSVEESSVKKYATSSSSGYYNEDELEAESMLSVKSNHQRVIIVVANTVEEYWGYCDYTLGMNIPDTYIHTIFRSWKTTPYKEGNWFYFVP